ncbi:MAG: hypothetical protein ACUVWX_05010 [Kiritimatiellia bacterium]
MKSWVRTLAAATAMVLAFQLGALAETLTLKPTKDARIMGHPQEVDQNGGTSTRLRTVGIQRSSAEFVIMDFDRSELKAFLEKNKDKQIKAKLVVVIREVEGVEETPVNLEVGAIDSAVDWNEGSGAQVKAQKGEVCAAAAQAEVKKWTRPDGTEVDQFRDLVWADEKMLALVNGKSVAIAKDTKNVPAEIELEPAFLQHFVQDQNCRGLFLFHRDQKAKIDIYSREQAQHPPKLVVTAE